MTPIKIVCEMVGGRYEGKYVSEMKGLGSAGSPATKWWRLSNEFALLGVFAIVPGECVIPQKHSYQVVSREEVDGVLCVRCEYRGCEFPSASTS